MKGVITSLTLFAVVMFAGVTQAADKAAPTTIKGTVVRVDAAHDLVIVKSRGAGGHETAITVTAKTTVIVSGQNAKLADLKQGQRVTITVENGIAQKIDATKAKSSDIAKDKSSDAPKAKTGEKPKAKPESHKTDAK